MEADVARNSDQGGGRGGEGCDEVREETSGGGPMSCGSVRALERVLLSGSKTSQFLSRGLACVDSYLSRIFLCMLRTD